MPKWKDRACGTCRWFDEIEPTDGLEEDRIGHCRWPDDRIPHSLRHGTRERALVAPSEGESCCGWDHQLLSVGNVSIGPAPYRDEQGKRQYPEISGNANEAANGRVRALRALRDGQPLPDGWVAYAFNPYRTLTKEDVNWATAGDLEENPEFPFYVLHQMRSRR